MHPQIDVGLKQFCDPAESTVIDIINKHKGYRPASRVTGKPESSLRRLIKQITEKAVMQGYSPEHNMTRTVPSPLTVKRISSNYVDGELKQQWVIAEPDKQRRVDMIVELIKSLKDDIPRLPPNKKVPLLLNTSLCNLYTFTDYHLGMMASLAETGTEWDLEKSKEFLTQIFSYMLANSPSAGTAIINQLGDFLHFDNIMPVTPTHGHVLDASARFTDLVKAALSVLRALVDTALTRHQKVIVILAEGNHDISSSIWLREVFSILYENEPRVEVVQSGTPYYAYQFGNTMLGFHHGHLKKNESLPLLFATRYPKMWGNTTKRYIQVGHRHHEESKEFSGVKIDQHPTLAPPDAHAARGGWDSEREATVVTYHSEFGRVARNTVTPEMLMYTGS